MRLRSASCTNGKQPIKILLGICLLSFCLLSCTPAHNIRPYPDFIKTAVKPGDRVEIETIKGEKLDIQVDEVKNNALISGNRRIRFDDITRIAKRSWQEPELACGDDLPLGCSIPQVVHLIQPVEDVMPQFKPACVQHDYCYRHGYKTYGKTREQCDNEFQANLEASCEEPKWASVINLYREKGKCLAVVSQMHKAVRRYGSDKFRTGNSSYCEYDGPPLGADN